MKYFTLSFLFVTIVCLLNAQTQQDTIYTLFTSTPVVVDGSDADACWAKADWHAIDQVWIPYNAPMDDGDFEGRYKAAWDADYLYLLVEVTDDLISDDHSDPLKNWWDDDCLELFIDEDRSKGNHECNNNAFAYHVSTFYDAIDMSASCGGINYRNNLSVVMDTIGENLYSWEFAVKMYNKNFNLSNPEASRVKLSPNKLMGFSIAYCDNDETNGRENFIGSIKMERATANDSYKNADYFGTMLLVDPENKWVSNKNISNAKELFSVFPSLVNDQITLTVKNSQNEDHTAEIIGTSGKVVSTFAFNGQQKTIDLSNLTNGVYFVRIISGDFSQTEKFIKL
jgi:hypothetical protein